MTFYINKITTDPLSGCVDPVYQTYHRSHTVGQCYKCPGHPIVYLNTPKCASSFLKTQVLNLNWKLSFLNLGPKEPRENPYQVDDIKTILVVLRDPYDRWLTGVAEYLWENYDLKSALELIDTPQALKLICKRVVLDDHTESQLYFLQNIPVEKCVFFKMENNLREVFSKYVRDNLNIPNTIETEKPVHVSSDDNFHGQIKTKLDRLVRENPVYYEDIQAYYEQDYEFMNMVKYYGN